MNCDNFKEFDFVGFGEEIIINNVDLFNND